MKLRLIFFSLQIGSAPVLSPQMKIVSKKKITKKKPCLAKFDGKNEDVVVLLVKEVTRSKDETIRSKDQIIQLLMDRKCSNCISAV